MTDFTQYDDDELVSEYEFCIYACERALKEGEDIAMYNRRRKEVQEVVTDRGLADQVDIQAEIDRAQEAARAAEEN